MTRAAPRYPAPAVRLGLLRDAPGTCRHRVQVSTSEAAYQMVAPVLQDLAQERFIALLLDARNRLLAVVTVAEGGMTSCAVDPRVLFSAALIGGAKALIVCHNHPSGSAAPSAQDLELTRALVAAGKLLCLPVLDHIIVGAGEFVSVLTMRPDIFAGLNP